MRRLSFMSLFLFSFFFLPWVSLTDASVGHYETKDNKSENENEGAAKALSSASRETETFLQRVKQELKAEFEVEINALKSKFGIEIDALKSDFEGKLHQQRVDFEDTLQAELRTQRSEMTSQFETKLKQQYDELTRQCQHTVTESATVQDQTQEMHASGMDENTHKRSDDLGPLQTVVAQATQRLDQMDADIRALQTRDTELQTAINAENQAIGTTYIRWGSNSCSSPSEFVYSGILGSGHYNSAGAPPNHLCLTLNPVYDDIPYPNLNVNNVYGSEYDMSTTDPKYQTTPACAVCRIPRLSIIMIPGTNQCESGWHLEYSGHVMAGEPSGAGSSEFICVDSKQDYLTGTQQDDNQNVLHLVQTVCGALGCPPYQNNKIATCVVCSK